jgi:hypothetical protein
MTSVPTTFAYSVASSSTLASNSTMTSSIRPSNKVTLCRKCMLQAYVLSVSIVSEVCCKGFQWILQKLIGMLHILQCCTLMLQTSVANVLSVFFRCMLQVCLSGCCICFAHMFLNVLSGCCDVLQCFSSVSCVFYKCFRRMFQSFHRSSDVCCKCCLNVSKVDRVLHLPPRLLLPRLLLPCILLRLGRGRAGGWRHGRERTLSPSITLAGSASVHFFCYAGMLR